MRPSSLAWDYFVAHGFMRDAYMSRRLMLMNSGIKEAVIIDFIGGDCSLSAWLSPETMPIDKMPPDVDIPLFRQLGE